MAPLGYFVSIGFFEKYNIPLPRQRYPKSAEKDDPSLLHLKGSATCSWGRIIGTVILSFDLASCLFFLFTVLLVYCISGGSPKTPEEYTTDGGFWLWDLVDTLLPFYTARGIQILTDIAFRCWEDVLFSDLEKLQCPFLGPILEVDYLYDELREKHERMLNIKEWVVAIGRVVSTGLFFGLFWRKAGWYSKTAIKNWNEGHPI